MHSLNYLPDVLLPYKDKILATVKPVINITLKPAKDLPLWASKIGGKPYLPKDFNYPTDNQGEPMAFLAQFDLSQLPPTDELPKIGLLSFFIGDNDGKVLYFDKIMMDNDKLHQDYPKTDYDEFLPFKDNEQFALNYELNKQLIGFENFNFSQKVFGKPYDDNELLDNDDIYDELSECPIINHTGHHLLGYPNFVQFDPRGDDYWRHQIDDYQNYISLLSLGSDDNIMWVDNGTGNFFIHPNDLKNGDFSKVDFWQDSL